MLGMVTTLMMHFPVGSMIDAMFFVLKGYRLDGPPRPKETHLNIVIAKSVTGHLILDGLLSVCKIFVMAIVYFLVIRHED